MDRIVQLKDNLKFQGLQINPKILNGELLEECLFWKQKKLMKMKFNMKPLMMII